MILWSVEVGCVAPCGRIPGLHKARNCPYYLNTIEHGFPQDVEGGFDASSAVALGGGDTEDERLASGLDDAW